MRYTLGPRPDTGGHEIMDLPPSRWEASGAHTHTPRGPYALTETVLGEAAVRGEAVERSVGGVRV